MNSKEIAVSIIATAVMADIIGFGLFVYPSMAQQQAAALQPLPEEPPASVPNTSAETPAFAEPPVPQPQNEGPRDMSDIDLSDMSSTMVLTTAWDLTGNPSRYAGRKMRMKGTYEEYTDHDGELHHSVLIKDAMGCCSQGIEFELANGEYPEKGVEIVVDGMLSTYKAPDPHLPDWVNKEDPRYDGVLNVAIVQDAVISG